MKQVFVLICLLNFIYANSQNSAEKRKSFVLEIAANEGQQYKAEIAESPFFVKDKILQIYCGEKVFIECEVLNDTIASMKTVEKNVNPKKTIEIVFTQDAKDRKQIITMLELTNPFDKDLVYGAAMLTPTSENWKDTSTIPIRAKLKSFETWPHSIISLALMNWKFK